MARLTIKLIHILEVSIGRSGLKDRVLLRREVGLKGTCFLGILGKIVRSIRSRLFRLC